MIDISRKYTTKKGNEVKFYAEYEDYVHGAISIEGDWVCAEWSKETGKHSDAIDSWNLVEVEDRIKGFIVIYQSPDGSQLCSDIIYPSLLEAERRALNFGGIGYIEINEELQRFDCS